MPMYDNENTSKHCIKELPGKELRPRWVVLVFEIHPSFWGGQDKNNPPVAKLMGEYEDKESAQDQADKLYPAWQAQVVQILVYVDTPGKLRLGEAG